MKPSLPKPTLRVAVWPDTRIRHLGWLFILLLLLLLAGRTRAVDGGGQDRPQVFEDNANKSSLEDRLRKAYDEFQKKNAAQMPGAEAPAADAGGKTPAKGTKPTKGAKGEDVEYKEMVLNSQAKIKELFALAEGLFKEGKFREAAAFYASVAMSNVAKTEQFVEDSRKRFLEMEVLAEEHLKLAMDADLKRDFLKEVEELSILTKDFPFTKVSETARSRLVGLKTRPEVAAQVELAEAEAAEGAGSLLQALKIYKAVAENPRYANGVAALKAKRKVEVLQKSEATREQLKAEVLAQADKVAPQLLAAAKNFIANSMPAKAKEKYQSVIERFPGTKYADEAQKELEKIQ